MNYLGQQRLFFSNVQNNAALWVRTCFQWGWGCTLLFGAMAQAADPALPSAGNLLQNLKSESVPAQSGSPLRAQTVPAATLPDVAAFLVSELRLSGNTLFDGPTLHGLVAKFEGQSLTLNQINDAIGLITGFYREQGYPLTRAILPAQTIAEGVVTIQIIEARLGDILWENRSQVNTDFLRKTVASLQKDQVISQVALDQALSFLSDVPGVLPQAVFQAGQLVGTSDLALEVQDGAHTAWGVLVDSYGSRYIGRERMAVSGQWFNPLQRGDTLSVSVVSAGSRLNYGRLSYEIPLDGHGSYFGAAASSLEYTLGDSAASLQAHGSVQQQSLWWRKYLVRGQAGNLGLRLQYDPSLLRDDVDSSASYNDRRLALWSLEVQADRPDLWFGGGSSTASLALRAGTVVFDNNAAAASDLQTAHTQGNFNVLALGWSRTQSLGSRTSVVASFNGQWAGANLDASQKFSLGGAHSVRAYESGVLSGDSGQFASMALFQKLEFLSGDGGQWSAAAFVEAGQVQINQDPWSGSNNHAFISGAGIGLLWQGPAKWHGRMSIARALAPAPSQLEGSASTHGHAWLELGVDF